MTDISQEEIKDALDKVEAEKAAAEVEGVTTKVTSIAEEEAKTGKKQFKLTEEQLITAASINMTKTLFHLEKLFKSMKAKQIVPAIIAGLDFPKDGMPVKWVDKTGQPKSGYADVVNAFMMIQRIISDRYVITQKHVIDGIKKHQAQEAAKELAKQSDKDNVTEEEPNNKEENNE